MPLDATLPLDTALVAQFAGYIRETRNLVNNLADAISTLGATTTFQYVTDPAYVMDRGISAVAANGVDNTIAITLPAANAVYEGYPIKFKKVDSSANIVTIWRVGADVIDTAGETATSYELTMPGESLMLVSDGVSTWYKFN